MRESDTRAPSSSSANGGGETAFVPAAGKRLGRYELVARVARGGMAEVWIARQRGELGFSRIVALKMIRAEYATEPSFRKMFLEEARLAAKLHHANAVEVLDLGEHERALYLAMAYIEGDSVAGLLTKLRAAAAEGRSERALPTNVAVRVMADVCAGLHAAHELTDDDGRPLDLVHRDVSPHNVLVGVDGVGRLTDFGIAKALGHVTDDTDTGQVKGKLSYLSPEQAKRLPPDRRSDVFAAGVVLWESLTGERLFRAEDATETLLNVTGKAIPDPRTVAEVPDAVAEVVMRALDRDPSCRFQTADEMRRALEAAARASHLAATSDVVADWVLDLVREDVERRRAISRSTSAETRGASLPPSAKTAAIEDDLERTSRERVQLEQTSTHTSSAVPNRPIPQHASKMRWWIVPAAIAACAAGAFWLHASRSRDASSSAAGSGETRSSSAATAESRASAASPSPLEVVPTAGSSTAVSSTTASVAASTSNQAPRLPTHRSGSPAASVTAHPTGSASQKPPMFGNPYHK